MPPPRELNTYRGLHAAYYDVIYAAKPYADEAGFIAERVDRYLSRTEGVRLLDLACGTGRHALEFARRGYSVTGVDYSDELLECARQNAALANAGIEFVQQDMRHLQLETDPYQVITCLFDSIGYPLTNEAIVEALASAAGCLDPEGVFVAEFLHAPAMLRHASPLKIGRWPTPDGGQLLRISESRLDVVRQLLHVSYELFDFKPDRESYEHEVQTQSNRFFAIEEMRALVASSGLAVAEFVPAYRPDEEEITEETFHILAFARPTVS